LAYYPNNPNGLATMANSAPVVIASDQAPVPINISSDVFEQVVVGSRYNQVEVNFSQTDPDLITDITVTKTNGGDAANSSGQAVFSTGTNTNGGIKAVSNGLVYYNPHSETFAAFSAVFTTGIANSYQRIGIYDANNGFFVGFNNAVFGVTLRKGGLDTFTAQASFNVDTLTGAANSTFRRNGIPEAIDFTKDNLYRIRFGWLGAAPIFFEVYSPDGDWVVFNVIRHPNTSTSASINNPDLPVTLDIQKTGAGATNLIMNTGCWGAGTTSDLKKLSDTLTDNSLAKTVKSVLAAKDAGGNYINIGATLTGNLETAIAEVIPGVTFPITDNGGSITVDGTVAATQSGSWNVGLNAGTNAIGSITNTTFASTQSGSWNVGLNAGTNYVGRVRLTDGTTDAEVVPLANYNAQAVAVVDGSGNQVTSFGGGTQYTDGAAVATPTGTVSLGFDGTNVQALSTTAAGLLNIADGGGSITVDGTVTANAGTGSFTVAQATAANLNATVVGTGTFAVQAAQSGAWTVGVNNAGGASAVNIQDGGNSITVDGTVAATQSGSWSVTNLANSGVDIGDVTINNAAGAAAVNIQDGGNSITIDGSVGLNAGTNYVGKVRLTDGTTDAEVVPLTGFNAQAVAIVDINGDQISNFGTQYLDGTNVSTPTGTVMLGFDGTDVQAVKALTTGELVITGDVPHDSPDAGDPVKIGFQAETALPTAVANGDRANGISDRYGRQLVAHIDPGMQTWKSAEYTSTQTGTNIWVPTAGRRFVVTQLNIATGGTTAGLVTIWSAQTATTAYAPGTDQVFFRGTLTPTANATPGALIQPPYPMFSDTTNDCLKITTSAAMTVYIQVYGYEITP
jgi:hypothetical protein